MTVRYRMEDHTVPYGAWRPGRGGGKEPTMAHDVIVVGTRVAGAATAMLAARAGLRVLAVDRASFPSDTLSTHQVQVPGVAALRRWGLLGRLVAAGTPATRRLRFDAGQVVLDGCYPAWEGADALYSPRRLLLDQILIDAAREAGAEVRHGFQANELAWDGGRVTGIRGRGRGGARVTETAPLVVGADGKRSLVARSTGAIRYRVRPVRTMASYSYWAGVPTAGGGEIYRRPGRAVAVFPTNDGLTMVYLARPAAEFPAARHDLAGHYLAGLDGCGDLAARLQAGQRAERVRSTPDLPTSMHVPYGPGWALVGDAGLVLDPVSAQGITRAFLDAERLTQAIVAGLGGGTGGLDRALAGYHRARDRSVRSVYNLTGQIARLRPAGPGERLLYAALAGRPDEISRFFGVLAGTEPLRRYRSASGLARLTGLVLTDRGQRQLSAAPATSGESVLLEAADAERTVRGARAG
jgi:2-polyprenyl-6-methoxyphenol hydroxylase-like FAD-dependent oxidoreductase